ncbi:hypothetical protein BDV10DRAFT_83836 [Aspergillus recurvatus]
MRAIIPKHKQTRQSKLWIDITRLGSVGEFQNVVLGQPYTLLTVLDCRGRWRSASRRDPSYPRVVLKPSVCLSQAPRRNENGRDVSDFKISRRRREKCRRDQAAQSSRQGQTATLCGTGTISDAQDRLKMQWTLVGVECRRSSSSSSAVPSFSLFLNPNECARPSTAQGVAKSRQPFWNQTATRW